MKLKKFISFMLFLVLAAAIFAVPSLAEDKTDDPGSAWNIYFRPGVRFGTESRVLYIMDFLIPLYQDEKNIVFSNIKYTPNDHDGWELNVGAGYRRLLWDDQLLLGLNAYYDQRKTDWGTNHEQWGLGLEAMA
ncbi:MAG: inverse autotransporter beta domain-containing protein, partial [Deltaproteobacteria bacterium]|nr:inverse autotransporter beta domain-containing protein [Candidatus Zymogenus saltonus]